MTWKSLAEMLADQANDYPEDILVRFLERGEVVACYTYARTWEWATRWAALFLERGVQRGEALMLALPNSEDFLGAFFGALLVGAVPAPVGPLRRVEADDPYALTLSRRLRFISARVLVVPEEQIGVAVPAPLSLVEKLAVVTRRDLPEDAQPMAPRACEDDLGLLQFTSGTSGSAKAVQLSHAALLAQTRVISKRLELMDHHQDSAASWLPLFHDMGLIGFLLTPAFVGGSVNLLLTEDFIMRPTLWIRALSEFGATITGGPPSAYALCARRIKDAEVEQYDLRRVRIALVGAEMITPESVQQFVDRFRPAGLRATSMMPTYGMAENGLAVTMSPLEREPVFDTVDLEGLQQRGIAEPPRGANHLRRAIASTGKPMEGTEVAVVGEAGERLGERQVGEIIVRSPSLMNGYYNQPEATGQALRGGWLRTGDVGYLERGELYVTGRKKEMIIVGGRNYYPDDLEEVAGAVSGVRKGRVVAVSYEDPARATEAVVLLAETGLTRSEERDALRQNIRKALVQAGFPISEVVLLRPKTIQSTLTGKLMRMECKSRFLAGEFANGDQHGPAG